jgi:hypothetical protein
LGDGFILRESIVKLREAHYWIPDSFQAKFSSGYYYPITSEYFSEEAVADVTVPGKHLFLGQGCVNHNSGKSYAILIILIRYIYEIWIHEDFPSLFGLSATTLPKIIFFSFSDDKAKSVGISRLIRMIDQIPFFQHPDRKRRGISTIVAFSWVEVWPGTQVEHAIGDDVFAGIMDEANIRGVAKAREVAEAQELFMELRMRSETTYSRNGVWAGFSAIISTAGKSTSFTDMEVAKAKRDGSRFLVQAAVYDVYPEGYSRERFAVYTGDGTVPSFIVDDPPQDVLQAITSIGASLGQFLVEKEGLMAHPPVSLRHFFEENIEVALQNLSGITRTGSSLFIANKSLIAKMFNPELKYPTSLFLEDGMPKFGLYDPMLPEELVNEDMINAVYAGERVYASFDTSRVNDHTGFSAIFYSDDQRKILPVLVTPIYMNRSIAGNEIDQVKLYGLVVALFRLGVNFRMVTCDGFSSDYIIQRCKVLLGNDHAERFSVDKNGAAHITMLNFMKLGMYCLYDVPLLRYELENLVYDPYVGKVDHPPNTDPVNPVYWKDISDSLAAASFQLAVYEDLSYEDMATQEFLSKARAAVAEGGEEPEDFYGDLGDGEDFYSDIGVKAVQREEPMDPVEKLMRDIMP